MSGEIPSRGSNLLPKGGGSSGGASDKAAGPKQPLSEEEVERMYQEQLKSNQSGIHGTNADTTQAIDMTEFRREKQEADARAMAAIVEPGASPQTKEGSGGVIDLDAATVGSLLVKNPELRGSLPLFPEGIAKEELEAKKATENSPDQE